MARAFLNGVDAGSQRIVNVADATAGTDCANRNVSSEDFKEYYQPGTLIVGVGVGRLYFPWNVLVLGCWISVSTAPTGASLIADVNKNGTTIYSTQANRPTITASGFVSTQTTPDGTVTLTALTDYLTIDIDQIGSTVAGANLTLGVRYRRN